MIGYLQGSVIYNTPPIILLNVQGVGYEVEMPLSDCVEIKKEAIISIYTHLIVRAEQHYLYGFLALEARQLFRQLLKVSGIGAKSGLAILSNMQPETFSQILQEENSLALSRLPGIGKKTAERIILELKGSLDKLLLTPIAPAHTEALEALLALGYKEAEAQKMLQQLPKEINPTTENLLRAALRLQI